METAEAARSRAGGRAAPSDSKAAVQLKREAAGLPPDKQAEMLRPPAPLMRSSLSAVQLMADVVQMVGGDGEQVPRSKDAVEEWMLEHFDFLPKYVDAKKEPLPEIVPLIAELQKLVDSGKRDAKTMERANDILSAAVGMVRRARPKEFEELRGVYKTMGHDVVPEWQATLREQGMDKREQAELAVNHRNWYKVIVRDLQTEQNSVAVMELRNIMEYGNEVGPSFQDKYDEIKAGNPDLSDPQIYDEIIGKARESNERINRGGD